MYTLKIDKYQNFKDFNIKFLQLITRIGINKKDTYKKLINRITKGLRRKIKNTRVKIKTYNKLVTLIRKKIIQSKLFHFINEIINPLATTIAIALKIIII